MLNKKPKERNLSNEVKKMKDLVISAHKGTYYAASALVYNGFKEADIVFGTKDNIHEKLEWASKSKYKEIRVVGVRILPHLQGPIVDAVKKIQSSNKRLRWFVIENRVNADDSIKEELEGVLFTASPDVPHSIMDVIKSQEPVVVEDYERLCGVYDYLNKKEIYTAGLWKKSEKINSDAEFVLFTWDQHFTFRCDPEGEDLKKMIKKLAFDKITNEDKNLATKYNYQYVDMVHCSPKMGKIARTVQKIGKNISRGSDNVSVLILGETGVGKDVIARQIHRLSGRKGPYFVINCAAIPENLLESEFFGYKKGAFTHAERDKQGAFEIADGGTLFLDEIAEIPVHLQAKLLRAIETLRILPLGAEVEKEVDVMIVAATNKNIKQLIKDNKFRLDLYQRISTIEITIPSLRERPEDIKLMAEFFLMKKEMADGTRRHLKPEEVKMMEAYWWPGNARQLQKFLERVLILEDKDNSFKNILDEMKKDDHLISQAADEARLDYKMREEETVITLEEAEKIAITRALKYFNYNLEKTKNVLGIGSRNTLIAKIEKYGIPVKGKNGGEE